MKSDKLPYTFYADIESLIKKLNGCANNEENSSTRKIGGHIPCGYSTSQLGHLIIYKTNALYIVENTV